MGMTGQDSENNDGQNNTTRIIEEDRSIYTTEQNYHTRATMYFTQTEFRKKQNK